MATLTIDLDDQATDGLEQLNAILEQSAIAAEEAGKGADELTESQQRQIVVINKTVAGWSELANTSIRAFGLMGSAGLNAFGAMEGGAERLLKVYGQLGKGAALTQTTAALGAQATGWETVGAAATTAGTMAAKAWLGIGPQVLGATVAIKGYEAILARTGLTTKELADGTTILESNLDRVNAATSKFGADVKTNFSESAAALKELTNISISFPDVWKEIDKVATQSAVHMVENIGLINDGYNETLLASQDLVGQMLGAEAGATRKLIEQKREQLAIDRQAEIQRSLEKEGLALLAKANGELANRLAARAEQSRIASLDSVAGVEAEIKAVKAAAAAQVKAGKFGEQAQAEYSAKLEALQSRQMAIEKDAAAKRTEYHKQRMSEYTDEMKAQDDFINRAREVYDLELKRGKEKSRQNSELKNTGAKQDFDTKLDVVKDTHEAEKDIATARLKSQGATEIEVKAQITEMDRKFSADLHAVKLQNIVDESRSRQAELQKERLELDQSGINGIEREKRLSKIKADEDKLIFDQRKKAIEETGRFDREQNKLTNDLKIAGIQAQLKAEEERINKTKAMNDQALAKVFDPKKFAEQQDPNKVFKQLQADRVKQAQEEQITRDDELGRRGMAGDDRAMKKFFDNQKKAMAQAKKQATQDAENGNFSEAEVTKAQANLGKETVSNFAKQGKLTSEMATAMQDQLTALANNANAIDNLQGTVDRLVAAAKGQKTVAKRQSENARNQANSLE